MVDLGLLFYQIKYDLNDRNCTKHTKPSVRVPFGRINKNFSAKSDWFLCKIRQVPMKGALKWVPHLR